MGVDALRLPADCKGGLHCSAFHLRRYQYPAFHWEKFPVPTNVKTTGERNLSTETAGPRMSVLCGARGIFVAHALVISYGMLLQIRKITVNHDMPHDCFWAVFHPLSPKLWLWDHIIRAVAVYFCWCVGPIFIITVVPLE